MGLTEEAKALLMFKRAMVLLLVIVAAAFGTVVYNLNSDSGEQLTSASKQEISSLEQDKKGAPENALVVYVSGAVYSPGLAELRQNARVKDAVDACGGFLSNADLDAVNLAKPVKDGDHIKIPEKKPPGMVSAGGAASGASVSGASGGAGASSGGLIDINTADEKALDSLPGVGPAMAKRIIEYRQTNGAFQTIEDLKKIKGIGEAKFAKMKDRVTV